MFSKCRCGGWIFPFISYETLTEGRKCSKCGKYEALEHFNIVNGIDYEDLIMENQEKMEILEDY